MVEEESPGLKLVLVSSRLKNASSVISAAQSDVLCIHYKFDSCSTQSILDMIEERAAEKQFTSLGLVMHSQGGGLVICGGKDREKILTANKVESGDNEEWQLFSTLISKYISSGGRLDIIATSLVKHQEGIALLDKIKQSLPINVQGWPSFVEDENGILNAMYFDPLKLQHETGTRLFQPTLAEFEKIRTVGKGAYGAAVLYRKKDDDSLVILKEINMHDLSYTERQLALNEVKVLGMLHHPNIIAYYDSFEEDGLLMIEMEYADGGTLAQYLATQEDDIPEDHILTMFRQMLEACKHLHDHNILHRDLKAANIFLTKNGMIKLGDFGISKILETKGASTVLGTPYYISPEMCEGKQYGPKSDVWALGCILYEMANREKAFEGSNLPALVNKIIKGHYKPVNSTYSSHLREIVDVLLTTDPDKRPGVDIVLNQVLGLVQFYQHRERAAENRQQVVRSMIYFLDTSLLTLCPIDLPLTCIIRTVSVGKSHIVATTELHSTYSWGEGGSGQLGHDNTLSTHTPTCIDALQGKFVTSVACGDNFTLFVTDNGLLMSCGSAASKCLGQTDQTEDVLKPKLCETLLSTDVVAVACGPEHAALTTKSGAAFTWGCGTSGRLGHGTNIDRELPTPVQFNEESVSVQRVRCGSDGTMFLTEDGTLYACGSNRYNKLGLNKRKGFLLTMKAIFYNNSEETEVSSVAVPTAVKLIGNKRCVEVSLGPNHSAVVVDTGQIYTFGQNKDGQLGVSTRHNTDALVLVNSMVHHRAKFVACCAGYTVAVTDTDSIFLWGTPPPTNLNELSLRGVAVTDSEESDFEMQTPALASGKSKKKAQSALIPAHSAHKAALPKSMSDPDIHASFTPKSGKNSRLRKTASDRNATLETNDMRINPLEISLTDAARRASASGNPGLNRIKRLISCNHSLMIQVSTNAPQKKKRKHTGRHVASSEDNMASSERSESANHERSSILSPETRSCVASATKLEDTQEDEELRTWLRLELEDGVLVTPTQKLPQEKVEGRQSDLETSGGIPSSNVDSAKSGSKDSGFETTQRPKQSTSTEPRKRELTDSDFPTAAPIQSKLTSAEKERTTKRRLRKKINAAVTEIETTDSEDELQLSASRPSRYRLTSQARRGEPYKDKFSLNWKDVRPNKASELRATKNPSNIANFKMRSPYRGPSTMTSFSRELECVQEKAELLQEKLAKLEERHAKQTDELENFKGSKTHLEDMFVTRWQSLEKEKQQTDSELEKYRKLLEEERNSATRVQGQLESEVKILQHQLENQKQQISNQNSVMFELQHVISSIQQRQDQEFNKKSKVCSIQ
ncbi:uncharacterized protein LOC134817233 [Bolinopsis microptera]|uniref:uncharacterized protein LOC134817233 n=1 Tax=Bolinopsis microptera TaxID=2820187 RepID=UPI003078CBCB